MGVCICGFCNVCVCVYGICNMYVCVHVCMCVCMYVYVCVCMCVCMYLCKYVCVYVCVCMYACMYLCVYVCMNICTHVCMYFFCDLLLGMLHCTQQYYMPYRFLLHRFHIIVSTVRLSLNIKSVRQFVVYHQSLLL